MKEAKEDTNSNDSFGIHMEGPRWSEVTDLVP
jgi:hypothetical protein